MSGGALSSDAGRSRRLRVREKALTLWRSDALVVPIVVAAALRLLSAGIWLRGGNYLHRGDSQYDEIATNLARHHLFAEVGRFALSGNQWVFVHQAGGPILRAFRPPGFPFLLGLVYAIGGRHTQVVALVQVAISIGTVGATYALGRRIAGAHVAWIAAMAMALSPYPAFHDVSVLDTGLFMLLFTLASWRIVAKVDGGVTPAQAAMAGVLLGAAALVRPAALLAVPVFLLLGGWRRGVVVVLAVVAVLLPWEVRTVRALHAPVFISTNGAITAFEGNNSQTIEVLARRHPVDDVRPPGVDMSIQVGTELESQRYYTDHLKAELRDAGPLGIAKLLGVKFVLALIPLHIPKRGVIEQVIVALQWIAIVPLAFVGFRRLGGKSSRLLLGGMIGAVVLSEVLFFPGTRLFEPAWPFLCVTWAVGVTEILKGRRSASPRSETAGAGWPVA